MTQTGDLGSGRLRHRRRGARAPLFFGPHLVRAARQAVTLSPRMPRRKHRFLLAFLAFAGPLHAAPRLNAQNADVSGITVSGLSSGGNMAVQFHVAHSASVKGAGALAAGPYYCAAGQLWTAYYNCMTPRALTPLPSQAQLTAATGVAGTGGPYRSNEKSRRRESVDLLGDPRRHGVPRGRLRARELLSPLRGCGEPAVRAGPACRARDAERGSGYRARLRGDRASLHQPLHRPGNARAVRRGRGAPRSSPRRRAGRSRDGNGRARRNSTSASSSRAAPGRSRWPTPATFMCPRPARRSAAACTWRSTAAGSTRAQWERRSCATRATTGGPTRTASSCSTHRRPRVAGGASTGAFSTTRAAAGTGGATPAPTITRNPRRRYGR